jgi:hypothetical protein
MCFRCLGLCWVLAPGLVHGQWILAAGPAYYGGGLSLQAIRETVVVALDALDSHCTVS